MFTQGLDSNALKWVGEVSVTVEFSINLVLVFKCKMSFLMGFILSLKLELGEEERYFGFDSYPGTSM